MPLEREVAGPHIEQIGGQRGCRSCTMKEDVAAVQVREDGAELRPEWWPRREVDGYTRDNRETEMTGAWWLVVVRREGLGGHDVPQFLSVTITSMGQCPFMCSWDLAWP